MHLRAFAMFEWTKGNIQRGNYYYYLFYMFVGFSLVRWDLGLLHWNLERREWFPKLLISYVCAQTLQCDGFTRPAAMAMTFPVRCTNVCLFPLPAKLFYFFISFANRGIGPCTRKRVQIKTVPLHLIYATGDWCTADVYMNRGSGSGPLCRYHVHLNWN